MRTDTPLLWAMTALIALAGPLIEGRERSADRTVQSYVTAIAEQRVEDALALITPETRASWRIFVEHQAGDRIQIRSLAVQRPPLIEAPLSWAAPQSVTVTADVRGKGTEQWRGQSFVLGRMENGQWLMARPVFGPDEPWLVPPES